MNACVNLWINELKINEWMSVWNYMNKWIKWMNDWMNEWVNEWLNEWMNEWMNEWIN